MFAYELKTGDVFTVDTPDPEGPVRICLSDDHRTNVGVSSGLVRWGFPGNDHYYCYMGPLCNVELVTND